MPAHRRQDFPALPAAAEWKSRLGWTSGQRAGACPLCGGTDRFGVTQRGGRTLVSCRHCLNRMSGSERAAAWKELLHKVFPERQPEPQHEYGQATDAGGTRNGQSASTFRRNAGKRGENQRRPDSPETNQTADEEAAARRLAQELWESSMAAADTPAGLWIAHRTGWPDTRPMPPSVRWIGWRVLRLRLPYWQGGAAAGAVAYGYSRPHPGLAEIQPVEAVQLEALTEAGRPALDKRGNRWRRCVGGKSGLVFECAGNADGGQLAELVLCEGELDAVALALHDEQAARVRGCGGTSGLKPAAAVGPWDTIRIESDGDSAGRAAAAELARTLEFDGHSATLNLRIRGSDPAAESNRPTREATT